MSDTTLNKELKKREEEAVLKLPPGWSVDELMIELRECMFGMSNTGICTACGEMHDQVEPDAIGYQCHECKSLSVCGVEVIFMSCV